MVNYGVHWQNNSTSLCVIGGLLLGIIASSRMFLFGKVTGVSGFLKSMINLDANSPVMPRIIGMMFVGGIICGGSIANHYIPSAFQSWKDCPMERIVIGGVLVGFGTAHGNGCTSGHGICGISNLRFRSLIATCCFMLSAIVVAMATDTQRFFPYFTNTVNMQDGGAIIGVCMGACFVLLGVGYLIKHTQPDNLLLIKSFKIISEVIFGICFGLSMAVTNMSLPSAVLAFLDLRYWNPALAFVMGSAIMITATSFYLIYQRDSPVLEAKFDLTKIFQVDHKLLIGALVFGVGWGLVGVCPAPALTNIGAGNIESLIFGGAIVFGQLSQMLMTKYLLTGGAGTGGGGDASGQKAADKSQGVVHVSCDSCEKGEASPSDLPLSSPQDCESCQPNSLGMFQSEKK